MANLWKMSLIRKITLGLALAVSGCDMHFEPPKPETFKMVPCNYQNCGKLKEETFVLEQRVVQPTDGFESMVRRNLKGYDGDIRPLWEAVRELNYQGIPLSKVMLKPGDTIYVPIRKL